MFSNEQLREFWSKFSEQGYGSFVGVPLPLMLHQ